MNDQMIEKLRQGMTEENRKEIFDLIAKAKAEEHGLCYLLQGDVELSKLITIACGLLTKATASYYYREPGFDTAYNATAINQGIDELMKNPAVVNFVQTIMLLTIALLTEVEDEPIR